jgi:hypothetical protein
MNYTTEEIDNLKRLLGSSNKESQALGLVLVRNNLDLIDLLDMDYKLLAMWITKDFPANSKNNLYETLVAVFPALVVDYWLEAPNFYGTLNIFFVLCKEYSQIDTTILAQEICALKKSDYWVNKIILTDLYKPEITGGSYDEAEEGLHCETYSCDLYEQLNYDYIRLAQWQDCFPKSADGSHLAVWTRDLPALKRKQLWVEDRFSFHVLVVIPECYF